MFAVLFKWCTLHCNDLKTCVKRFTLMPFDLAMSLSSLFQWKSSLTQSNFLSSLNEKPFTARRSTCSCLISAYAPRKNGMSVWRKCSIFLSVKKNQPFNISFLKHSTKDNAYVEWMMIFTKIECRFRSDGILHCFRKKI